VLCRVQLAANQVDLLVESCLSRSYGFYVTFLFLFSQRSLLLSLLSNLKQTLHLLGHIANLTLKRRHLLISSLQLGVLLAHGFIF